MRNAGKLSAVMAAWELPTGPTEKLVLICIVQHVNPQTETAWPSVARLCRLTGLSRRSVQRAMAELETAGAISRADRPGRVTEYRLTMRGTGAGTETDPRHSDAPPAPDGRTTRATVTPHPRHSDARTCIEHGIEHEHTQEGASVNSLRDVNKTQELRDELQRAYPKRAPLIRWDWQQINARLAEGVTGDELKAAAKRYATYCDATGITATRFVMYPERFFTAGPDAPWRQPFVVSGGKSESGTLSAEQRAEMSSDREAHRLGIPHRQNTETLDQYQRRVRASVISESLAKMARQGQGRNA